jgi:hypothetical protein
MVQNLLEVVVCVEPPNIGAMEPSAPPGPRSAPNEETGVVLPWELSNYVKWGTIPLSRTKV